MALKIKSSYGATESWRDDSVQVYEFEDGYKLAVLPTKAYIAWVWLFEPGHEIKCTIGPARSMYQLERWNPGYKPHGRFCDTDEISHEYIYALAESVHGTPQLRRLAESVRWDSNVRRRMAPTY